MTPLHLYVALVGADPTPSPIPEYTGDPNLVTPGVVGFVAIALIAIVTVLLLIDMTRRVRRVRYRAEVNERLDAEQSGTSKPTTAPED